MSAQDHERVSDLFVRATQCNPARRRAFLDDACRGDAELRREVESLLASQDAAPDFLRTGGMLEPLVLAAGLPERIGPYEIVEEIGEGGMGIVCRAIQREPFRRQVALKLLRGLESRQAVARFRREAQALALMDHPNIARVFDGGVSEDGRLFFAMELVEGTTITEHCDERRLSVLDRLELFREVCEGVQHAHDHGIVHRDLKPSNVLVTETSGRPRPKLIDFGVAALHEKGRESTLQTEFGQLLGTLDYMSPEQAEMDGRAVGPAADVYSLGVLLYELLTGVTPHSLSSPARPSLDEMRRVIREVDPPPPSAQARLDATSSRADSRSTAPSNLSRLLRGDLDTIVLRALEKVPARRYASPADLAGDLALYLEGRPIVAAPSSVRYRAAKFLVRHRRAWAAVGVFCVFSVALAMLALHLSSERRAAGSEARERQYLSIFGGMVDIPDHASHEVLDRSLVQIHREGRNSPLLQGRWWAKLAESYAKKEIKGQAVVLLEKAQSALRRELGPDDPEVLKVTHALALFYIVIPRLADAERELTELVRRSERRLGVSDPATLLAKVDLGWLFKAQRRLDEADRLVVPARRALIERMGIEDPFALHATYVLSSVRVDQGRQEEAAELVAPVIDVMQRVLEPGAQDTLASVYTLARVRALQGRTDEAVDLLRQVCDEAFLFSAETEDGGYTYGIGALRIIPELKPLQGHPGFEAIVGENGYLSALYGSFHFAKTEDETLSYLRTALERGYVNPDFLLRAPAFWELHEHPEFQAIVAEMRRR